MLESLFTSLSRAIEGTSAVALSASFVWGILSILLSPCHLSSIPLIVGFIDEQGRISTGRAFSISALFSIGILVSIAAIAVITGLAGRMIGDVGRWGNYFVALIFFLVGLHLLDIIPMPWSGPGQVGMKRKGLVGSVRPRPGLRHRPGSLHLCLHGPDPHRARSAWRRPVFFTGSPFWFAYGLGHCSVIVCAGTFTEVVQQYLELERDDPWALRS